METRGFYRWHSKWPGDGGQHLLSRRVLLASALACVSKAQNTEISNFDLSLLDEWTVPSDLFFVRNHFPVPNVSAAGWKLQVNGAVSMPFEISYEDLLGLPRKSLPVTIECAENQVGGGLVSHAEWGGFSLASILTKAVTGQDARFVRLS